jgi:hypothetical protein
MNETKGEREDAVSELEKHQPGAGGKAPRKMGKYKLESETITMNDALTIHVNDTMNHENKPKSSLKYKSNCFLTNCNPLCCCDYLPHRALDYSEVDISGSVLCISGNEVMCKDFNEHVIRNILLPYYDIRLKYLMNSQICWSRAGNVAYTTSSVLVGIASVLSFASGTYPSIHMNFIAGSLGLLALVCKEFASYSNTLDHAKVTSVNKILRQLQIAHELSDTSLDVSSIFNSSFGQKKN